jgi:hypothetical protein
MDNAHSEVEAGWLNGIKLWTHDGNMKPKEMRGALAIGNDR